MRILFTCTDAELGGAERFLATLGAARSPEDTVALVVLMAPGAMSDQFEAAFDEVTYLGYSESSRNLFGMVRALGRAVQAFKPDVISSHLFHADLVTALLNTRVPKTTTVHTQGFGPADHPLTKLIARAIGLLSFRFGAVIPASPSPEMATFVAQLRMRNVVAPIANGAAVPDVSPHSVSATSFLSLARNHPVKGHRELFAAFARFAAGTGSGSGGEPHTSPANEWTLDAYGTNVTADDPAMQLAITEAGATELLEAGRITLHGPTTTPEEALATAGALVISSTYGEAFPIIGAEAAGAGLPVITTDVGSCSEFVDNDALLVAPGDVGALAQAMRVFSELPEHERQRLSSAARERAKREYSPSAVYANYRAVFSRLTQGKA